MPIVELNNIETAIDEGSSIIDVVIALSGVVLGYGLSEITSWYRRKLNREKVGRLFVLEVIGLEQQLNKQIEHFEELVKDTERATPIKATLYISDGVKFISEIDRLTVQDYFDKENNSITPEEIRKIYNCVTVVRMEANRFQDILATYNGKMSKHYENYKTAVDLISRSLADYRLKNSNAIALDPIVLPAIELFDKQFYRQPPGEVLNEMTDRFHLPFMDLLLKDHKHELYDELSRFNQDALDCINGTMSVSEWMGRQLKVVNTSLLSSLKTISSLKFASKK
jgi:hypothetical protein